MKNIFLTVSLLALPLITTAAPKSTQPNRPAALVCQIQVEEGQGLPQTLTITGLNTHSPSTSIPDAPLMEPIDEAQVAKTDLLRLGYSNECDNSYDLLFMTDDLAMLKRGEVKQISALIRGGSADIELLKVQARGMTCQLK